MDIATLFGLFSGIALIVYSIAGKEGEASYFWDFSSLLLVLGVQLRPLLSIIR
jgi:flagellar motor component MotA